MADRRDFYVYVHLRADDWLPFYVGKGRGVRSSRRDGRNTRWLRTEAKHGKIVKLLWCNLTESEAFDKERQAIRDLRAYSKDTMTNMTDGGEGSELADQTTKFKQDILEFFAASGRFPSKRRQGEQRLASRLSNYCSPSSVSHDSAFRELVCSMGYCKKQTKEEVRKEILDFFYEFGRPPSSAKKEERHLNTLMSNRCSPSSGQYDPELRAELASLGFAQNTTEDKKAAIREFYRSNGRLPKKSIKTERTRALDLERYCSPSAKAYDPEFSDEMRSIGYGKHIRLTYLEIYGTLLSGG